jgi:HK97 family phage major capsid protein
VIVRTDVFTGQEQKELEKQAARLAVMREGMYGHLGQSIGKQFVESREYEMAVLEMKAGADRGGKVGPPRKFSVETKAVLTEAASPIMQPSIRPPLPVLFRQPQIAALMPQPPGITGNTVRTPVETTSTNAAAAVAEGGLMSESTLVIANVDEPIRRVGEVLPVSLEMFSDAGPLQVWIDQQLMTHVGVAEDDQLLNGNGTTPNLVGILNRSGLAADQARGADTNADAILKQMVAIWTATFLAPDAVIINPAQFQTMALDKDSAGFYKVFAPTTPADAPIWRMRVVVTPAIAAGTALVGAFGLGGQVYRRQAVTIESSPDHADYFGKDLVGIRASERVGLGVLRPAAFGRVTGMN